MLNLPQSDCKIMWQTITANLTGQTLCSKVEWNWTARPKHFYSNSPTNSLTNCSSERWRRLVKAKWNSDEYMYEHFFISVSLSSHLRLKKICISLFNSHKTYKTHLCSKNCFVTFLCTICLLRKFLHVSRWD